MSGILSLLNRTYLSMTATNHLFPRSLWQTKEPRASWETQNDSTMYTQTQKCHVCIVPLHHLQSVLLSLYHLGVNYVPFSTCIHDHSSSCLLCTWGAMTISRGKYSDFQLCVTILFLKALISTSLFAATCFTSENRNRLSWTTQRCEGSGSASSCLCQCAQNHPNLPMLHFTDLWSIHGDKIRTMYHSNLVSDCNHKKNVHFSPLILQPFCTQDSAAAGKGRAGGQSQLWAGEEQSAA